MKAYIKLLRPHQYLKNGFIFFPLFFSFKFRDLHLLGRVAVVAACFCLVASAIYILNDYFDIEEDRKHPEKKHRPLASGAVPVRNGLLLMVILLAVGGAGISLISWEALMLTGFYVVNNLLYSFRLKHIAILDVSMIAVGFCLRLFIGSAAGEGQLPLSMWIIMCTFLLALFLALAKRRDDVLLRAEGKKVRKSIDGYNLEFINGAMVITATLTIVGYISYCISEEVTTRLDTHDLFFTVIFVILGILRYMQITFVEEKSGSPTKVLIRDLFLQLVILGWLVTFVLLVPAARNLIF
ncbi:MAG: UbiA prenyltransferase family protein [Bacteroidota bacterium]